MYKIGSIFKKSLKVRCFIKEAIYCKILLSRWDHLKSQVNFLSTITVHDNLQEVLQNVNIYSEVFPFMFEIIYFLIY